MCVVCGGGGGAAVVCGGVRRVAWVSVVLRSGCLALPFIVPVSYKMDYDQGVKRLKSVKMIRNADE